MEALIKIQSELKAPKNQFNNFGKYKYRNCEDILEALKPLLSKYNCTLTISDHVREIGGILVVEASASFTCGENSAMVNAQAGIDTNRKGMDIAQSFGASSSYARKYALNGLFLIDDTKDPDSTNTHDKDVKTKQKATESTIKAMVDAVGKGQKNEVIKAMDKYSFTPEQALKLKEVLNGL